MCAPQVFEPHYRTSPGMSCPGEGAKGFLFIARGFLRSLVVAFRSVGFSVQLDQLRTENCPKYLAKCLEYGLEKCPIQDRGISELRKEGGKELLEVFNKVR